MGGKRRAVGPMEIVGIVVVAVLVLVAVVHRMGSTASGGDASAYPTQSVPAGVSVKTTASATASGAFQGTPAQSYPKGAAGITVPAAKAVPGFTAAEVKAAPTATGPAEDPDAILESDHALSVGNDC